MPQDSVVAVFPPMTHKRVNLKKNKWSKHVGEVETGNQES